MITLKVHITCVPQLETITHTFFLSLLLCAFSSSMYFLLFDLEWAKDSLACILARCRRKLLFSFSFRHNASSNSLLHSLALGSQQFTTLFVCACVKTVCTSEREAAAINLKTGYAIVYTNCQWSRGSSLYWPHPARSRCTRKGALLLLLHTKIHLPEKQWK